MFSFNQFDSDKNTFLFYNQGTVSVRTVPFIKPPGISFVHILAVGGGGGGGAGASWTSSTLRYGGGGGGGSSVTVGLFPANLLPDTLYVSVGQGGAGASVGSASTPGAGNNGVAGKDSTVYLVNQPALSSTGGILLEAFGGDGGNGGSRNALGAGGGATVAATLASMPAAGIGTFTATDGPAGADGTSSTPADSASPYTTSFVSGGGGGGRITSGNVSGSGGSSGATISGILNTPVISGGSSTNNGQNGIVLFKPHFVSLGGGGGGSGTTIVGNAGNGGNGGIGSGGGGGGAGVKTATGDAWNAGFGGDGGDGGIVFGSTVAPTAGSDGGNSILAAFAMTIDNGGIISGGSGGGGGACGRSGTACPTGLHRLRSWAYRLRRAAASDFLWSLWLFFFLGLTCITDGLEDLRHGFLRNVRTGLRCDKLALEHALADRVVEVF